MKNALIAAMLGSTAMAGAALAQEVTVIDTTEETDPAMQAEGGFITWQDQDQMIASNLMGADVWGAENESIGAVDDLLLDRDGQIIAVIVGIGGFLGIGERDVAISTDQLEFVLAQDAEAIGAAPGAGVPAGTVAQDPAMMEQPEGMAADGTVVPVVPAPEGTVATDQTGTVGTAAPGTTGMAPGIGTGMTGTVGTDMTGTVGTGATGAGWGWTGSVIDHIQVDYTREQLEAAPAFETVE